MSADLQIVSIRTRPKDRSVVVSQLVKAIAEVKQKFGASVEQDRSSRSARIISDELAGLDVAILAERLRYASECFRDLAAELRAGRVNRDAVERAQSALDSVLDEYIGWHWNGAAK